MRVSPTAFAFLLAASISTAQQRPDGLYAVFNTSMGTITARLYEKDVRETVENFVGLAQGTKATRDPKTGIFVRRHFYDGITFHRIVHGEMIQAGDPTGTGANDCGVNIQDEILPGLRFDTSGKLAMANTGDPNSAGCQFFITSNPMHSWNGKYAVFGIVVEGLDVVSKINRVRVRNDKPLEPVTLINVKIERVGPEPVKKKKK